MKAILALEDGRIFWGKSFTGSCETAGEIVFNTGMTGYQEILTDPSYAGQMVTMTYPLIGNYGVNPEDVESSRIQAAGFIVREYQDAPSNFRATGTLAEYLRSQGIPGITGIDTRAVTRHIRNTGAMRAFISTQELDPESAVERARQIPSMAGLDLVKNVTTRKPYIWKDGKPLPLPGSTPLSSGTWDVSSKKKVVAFDFGIKYNILRYLESQDLQVVVVPADSDEETVKGMEPDGIFLSNGPGDPQPVEYAIDTIRRLIGYRPMFGICLGHQLMGLALNAKTFKLKFGHRGINQPVKNLLSGRIEITSQNHGFAVDLDSISDPDIEITHVNLNDNTLEGFRHKKLPMFAVQYHPEASPGPHDADYLFHEFRALL